MTYNSLKLNRQSYRLKNYDYSSEGLYFVTILTKNRERLLSEIINEKVHLSDIGNFLERQWLNTPSIRSNFEVHDYVIMPDHFHGIVQIKSSNNTDKNALNQFKSPSNTIGSFIRGLKVSVIKDIKNWNSLKSEDKIESIWHRNYHDRIIKSQQELENVQRYIADNPKKWKG